MKPVFNALFPCGFSSVLKMLLRWFRRKLENLNLCNGRKENPVLFLQSKLQNPSGAAQNSSLKHAEDWTKPFNQDNPIGNAQN